MFVLRQTYGYHKTQDQISISQFEKHIPFSGRAIKRALKILRLVKILTLVKKGNSRFASNVWAFNKNYTEWQLVKKAALVNKTSSTSDKKRKRLVTESSHTKETITKETIQKKYIPKKKLVKVFNHDFERIKLTPDEMDKLQKKFGSELRNKLIDFENAIGARDYKYKSHYRAMLKWYDKPKTPDFYRKEMEALSYPVFCNKYSQKLADKYVSV